MSIVHTELARVRGRVQGVGFRESCVDAARALGIAGWVRNRADGSVEAMLRGSPGQLAQMHDWLRRGPPAARVDALEIEPQPDAPVLAGFERRPSA
jgi:acylphosphatase